jgi:hypothetical protein
LSPEYGKAWVGAANWDISLIAGKILRNCLKFCLYANFFLGGGGWVAGFYFPIYHQLGVVLQRAYFITKYKLSNAPDALLCKAKRIQ